MRPSQLTVKQNRIPSSYTQILAEQLHVPIDPYDREGNYQWASSI